MLEELLWLHSKLNNEECMRIILSVKDWTIYCDKTDLVGEFNGCFRIVRSNGRIISINPSQVIMASTISKRSALL